MSEIKVDKGVEVPKAKRGKRPAIYPFSDLEIGDSFYVKGKTPGSMNGVRQYWHIKLGHRYATRTEGDGIRVWRIA